MKFWPSLLESGLVGLGQGLPATKQGERSTASEPARRTVLDRLLQLNHARHAEEVKTGLRDKCAKKSAEKKSETGALQAQLIKPPQQELYL